MESHALAGESADTVARENLQVDVVSRVRMDIREYASGGKSNRLGLTRQGNRYLRTALIEANQRGYRTARLSYDEIFERPVCRGQPRISCSWTPTGRSIPVPEPTVVVKDHARPATLGPASAVNA